MKEVGIMELHGQEVRLCEHENIHDFILNVSIRFLPNRKAI